MSDRIHVGTRKGLFTLQRGARGWRVSAADFLGDNVSMLLSDRRDGTLLVALDHGHFGAKLHRSTDGGRTFAEVAVPAYPERPDDYGDLDPIRQRPLEWKLRRVWELAAGGADQPGLYWCGTIPGGLFRTRDAGESWELVESLWHHPDRKRWFGGGADYPGLHSVSVHPRDSEDVTVGVSCGGVWHTPDGGLTWEVRARGMRADFMPPEQAGDPVIQDPHRVVQCPARPEALWAQHHCGIFRSTDAGRSWTEIPEAGPSTFGFAVAVHPEDPDTAWFVPALSDQKRHPVGGRVVVTRTRDGGRSFEVLRQGLPQEHAYDLVWRHALDLAPDGQSLAFGSTTGSLWTSSDAGDSWETVSTHLPPVHVVRFA